MKYSDQLLISKSHLSMNIETWERARHAPGWVRDRFIGFHRFSETDNTWEITETIVSESISDGKLSKEYFLSLLVDCYENCPTELDLGVGKFVRTSQAGNMVFGDTSVERRYQGTGPFHTIVLYIDKESLHARIKSVTARDNFDLEPLLSKCFRDNQLEQLIKSLLISYQCSTDFIAREQLLDAISFRLYLIAGNQSSRRWHALTDRVLVDQSIEFMHAHMSEKISVEMLARVTGLSRSQFACVFRQTMGISPAKYLMKMRIAKATDLMRQLSLSTPTAQIAELTGFSDRSHLSREFKKATGLTLESFRCR